MIDNEDFDVEEDDQLNKQKTSETLPDTINLNEVKEEEDIDKLNDELYSDYKENICSMKAGSIQGSVFSLSSMALGTGAFALPIRCSQIGCVWFCLSIIFGSIITYWTLSNLIKSARKVYGEEYSTSVKKILGKIPAIIIDFILMLYLFGIIIQFSVIIYALIGRTYFEFFVDKTEYLEFDSFKTNIWNLYYIKLPVMFGLTALLIPLCLLKDISKMRFTSMIGVFALIYSILVVVIETPWFYKDYIDNVYREDDSETHANWFDITKGFTSDLNFFSSIATIFFCYTCHPGAFPVFKSLKYNNEKRINQVFLRSIGLDLIIYLSIAICGFLTSPISKEPLIIFRKSIFKNDIFMNIAKISLALDLYLSIPVNYNSFRMSFFILVFKTNRIDTWKNIFVTLPVLILATFIGAIFEDILSYIALLGGFCCSIICFLIPGCLMVKTSKEKIYSIRNILTIIIIGLLCCIGFTAGVLTVIKIASNKDVK